MSSRYERNSDNSGSALAQEQDGSAHGDVLNDAARALREAELEAAQPEIAPSSDTPKIEQMSIDDLRKLAAELNIPNRAAITEQAELLKAIRERL